MSTHWGYACTSHEPMVISERWFNHGEETLRDAFQRERAGIWTNIDEWGSPAPVLHRNYATDAPIHWLREHPNCTIVLRNEYGDVKPIRSPWPHFPTCICDRCKITTKEITMTERNTTVTLDLKGRDIDEVVDILVEAAGRVDGGDFLAWVASLVREQCPPVLEVGWHEVLNQSEPGSALRVRYWDGKQWRVFANARSTSTAAWKSVRFLAGPA